MKKGKIYSDYKGIYPVKPLYSITIDFTGMTLLDRLRFVVNLSRAAILGQKGIRGGKVKHITVDS